MGYFIVRYDDLQQLFSTALHGDFDVFVSKDSVYDKVWFAIVSDGVTTVHEHHTKRSDLEHVMNKMDVRWSDLLLGDYEYVK